LRVELDPIPKNDPDANRVLKMESIWATISQNKTVDRGRPIALSGEIKLPRYEMSTFIGAWWPHSIGLIWTRIHGPGFAFSGLVRS
jgi:hypothetical protein